MLKLQTTPGRYDADEVQLHGFLLEKMSQKKTPGWTDIPGPGPVSQFFIQKFHVLHYADST